MHAFVLLFALATPAAPPAPATPPPVNLACQSPEQRQFDFWVGQWAVTGKAGKVVGGSRVEGDLDGCVVVERWAGSAGSHGRSLNVYNASLGQWEQFYVDNQGNRLWLRGGLRDGAMVLETPPNADGSPPRRRDRITWTPQPDGRVRQLWEMSLGGGEWSVQFDGMYSRVE